MRRSMACGAIVLGLGQGGTFSLALTLIVLRSRDAHVAANLSSMAQGIGYTLASWAVRGGPGARLDRRLVGHRLDLRGDRPGRDRRRAGRGAALYVQVTSEKV
jgi:CP family cyanate transporter-like MFS transporter